MCPRGGALLGGSGSPLAEATLVAHCFLIEAGGELVLVDTGYGTGDCATPKRLGQPFRALVRPQCNESETAVRLVESMGFKPSDVRHIVVTHLDLDHAGGLVDFPEAHVHVFAPELAASKAPPLRERGRYLKAHFAHGPNWVEHEVDGEGWFGFDSVRLLPDIDGEIALVPLVGHSTGHAGVAVNAGNGWLLHCGDAYFHHGEVQSPASCPVGLRVFQNLVGHNAKTRRHNQERLRELAREHAGEVRLVCSHDPADLG